MSMDDQQLPTQIGVGAARQSLPSAVPPAERSDGQQSLFPPDSFTNSLRRAQRHPRNPLNQSTNPNQKQSSNANPNATSATSTSLAGLVATPLASYATNRFINPLYERPPPQPPHLLASRPSLPSPSRQNAGGAELSIANDGDALSLLNQQVVAAVAVAAQRTQERYLTDAVAKAAAASRKKSSLFG